MKTVKEVSEMTGVSIRALRYYDEIGLLKPTAWTDGNYRLYDESTLAKLQMILFFRELELPLKSIKSIMENPANCQEQTLLEHKTLLEQKRNHLNGILARISDILQGANTISFEAFTEKDITAILNHVIKQQSPETLEAIVQKFGSREAFCSSIAAALKADSPHYLKLYDGRESALKTILQPPLEPQTLQALRLENDAIYRDFAKARENSDAAFAMECVARPEENARGMFRLANARYLLLKIAEDYAQTHKHPAVLSAIEKTYGAGITDYVAKAIYQFYGIRPPCTPL